MMLGIEKSVKVGPSVSTSAGMTGPRARAFALSKRVATLARTKVPRFRPMLALSDRQLAVVKTAARGLPVEKRGVFLERVAARLRLRGSLTDLDFDDAARLALRGLIQEPAA